MRWGRGAAGAGAGEWELGGRQRGARVARGRGMGDGLGVRDARGTMLKGWIRQSKIEDRE
jgi:hypothetical protein